MNIKILYDLIKFFRILDNSKIEIKIKKELLIKEIGALDFDNEKWWPQEKIPDNLYFTFKDINDFLGNVYFMKK